MSDGVENRTRHLMHVWRDRALEAEARAEVVEAERDEANVHAIECERIGVEAIEARLMETARAESAEAALAGVGALHPMERWITALGRSVLGCATCRTAGPCDTAALLAATPDREEQS